MRCVNMQHMLPRRARRGRAPEGVMRACMGNEQRTSSLVMMSTSSCLNLSKNVLLHGNQITDNSSERKGE